jgi:glycosyltransferase involved in cell wall biosynthesis
MFFLDYLAELIPKVLTLHGTIQMRREAVEETRCVGVMSVSKRRKTINSQKMSTLWVSFTFLDAFLHKTALLNVLRQFAEFGHKPSLLAVRSRNAYQIEDARVRIISVPLRYMPLISPVMFTIVLVLFLPVFIIISRPDFIIFDPDVHILSCFPVLFVSKFEKVKSVLDIRTVPVETVGFRGFLRRFWFSVSILVAKKLFDGITIITPSMKKKVCNDFDLNPDKVGVWTSGVSDSLFNPKNFISRSAELKRKLGLTGKFVVFYHGVFTPTRGLTETIDALKLLLPKYPDIVFFLLGTGPLASKLSALIQKEGLQGNIIIANPVDHSEVPKFISMCDIGIIPLPDHPYWRFQSPLKLLEYLAMEKAVILTDILAHRAVIGEAKCGIYISSVKPMEIANAIEYVYLNRDTLEERGKIGREIVKREYTWEKVAGKLENYLLSIDELREK